MLQHLHNLTKEEQNIVLESPFLVSILIAGADNEIDEHELEKTLELIHTKSYSESHDIKRYYQDIEHNASEKMNQLIADLPKNKEEREAIITQKLSNLNAIFTKIDYNTADHFYKSLINFATHVAHASGGIFGLLAVNYEEKEVVKLTMIQAPIAPSE